MARCASCGAALPDGEVRLFCGQCGARVADGVVDLEAYRGGPERFDRVAVAPEYPAALRHAPVLSASREVGGPVVRLVVGVVILIFFAAVAVSTRDWKVMLFVAAVGLIWLVSGVRAVAVGLARLRASTARLIALVTGDQHTAAGGRKDPAGNCEHRVTLSDRDGHEREVFAEAALMGEVAVGDIGVAYLRRDRLVDYRWLDIMAPPLEPGEMPRSPGCRTCGAHQRFGHVSERCTFCDQPLPRPDLGEFGARFRAAAASPKAVGVVRRKPRGHVPSLLPALLLLAAGCFTGWFAFEMRELFILAIEFSPWFLFLLVPPLAPLVGGAAWLWRRSAPHRAGRSNELAVVVRTRSQPAKRRGELDHFVTIAGPNGTRRELRVMKETVEWLGRGQIGVVHLRGEWLAAFTRLDQQS